MHTILSAEKSKTKHDQTLRKKLSLSQNNSIKQKKQIEATRKVLVAVNYCDNKNKTI